ncbi:MAG: aspartate-semialdehyde dehydrogenase [Planctomycetes bacterium]|nr:aspartate-semialdehyde dehydrogenase [Planctomycetota bacterium]
MSGSAAHPTIAQTKSDRTDSGRKTFCVSVIGATGAVGRETLQVLEKRRFPVSELRLFCSDRSAGETFQFNGRPHAARLFERSALEGSDFAILCVDAEMAKTLAPMLADMGVVTVDNSSAFRNDPAVPLVVPEINGHLLKSGAMLVANPNCTTIVALMAAAPLHRAAYLRRMTVCSYQAVSGAGIAAMRELESQARTWAAGGEVKPQVFPRPALFNVFPHNSPRLPDGSNEEERKLVRESRRLLACEDLRVSATCVRVPTLRAHAVALHLEFEKPLSPAQAAEILSRAPGVRVVDESTGAAPADSLMASGLDEVLVSRIRVDDGGAPERSLALWSVGDQLLKGAALNAVQIVELLAAGCDRGG